jgi:hypothetical protein
MQMPKSKHGASHRFSLPLAIPHSVIPAESTTTWVRDACLEAKHQTKLVNKIYYLFCAVAD